MHEDSSFIERSYYETGVLFHTRGASLQKRFAPLQKLVTICPTVLLKTRKNVFSGTWCLDFLPVQAFLYRTLIA